MALVYTIEAVCGKCGEVHQWDEPELMDVLTGAQLAEGRKPRITIRTKGGGAQVCGLNYQGITIDKVLSSTFERETGLSLKEATELPVGSIIRRYSDAPGVYAWEVEQVFAAPFSVRVLVKRGEYRDLIMSSGIESVRPAGEAV